jgi:hypothetical protein
MLFVGTLYCQEEVYLKSKEKLISMFGPVFMETSAMPWEYTDYYKEELGSPILRRFIFFENLITQDEIADIKLRTNTLEAEFSVDGKRRINLDPGYLTPAKIVLASTKDYSHRIYLGRGIYAEVTLIYSKGRFHPHIYTYRDYQDEKYLEIFMDVRERLKARLKEE